MHADMDGQVYVGDPCYKVRTDKPALKSVEMTACRRNQVALGLMDVLFSPEVLAGSTVN